MRSLREFAQFVGKPNPPISPVALADYLRLAIKPGSVREMIQAFEVNSTPVALESASVQPSSEIIPFKTTMQLTGTKGYIFGVRWRILRGGQQVAVYERLLDRSIPGGGFIAEHTFAEPGTYTAEATVKGIGSSGYAEATKSFSVVARSKPGQEPKRLTLFLGPTELIPNTLRIISINWKVTPLWNPSQVFNLTGSGAQVTLPNPPPSADRRVQVELRFRCAVAGVINGIQFPPAEFEGVVDPFPTFVGWEGKSLNAGWFPLWDLVPVEDGDDNPNNNPVKVVVVAKLQNIESPQ